MPEDHRLAPYPNLPDPVTERSIERYLEGNLPHDWAIDRLKTSGAASLLVTDGPVRIDVVKPATLPDDASFREVRGDGEATGDLEAFRDAVAITCSPVLTSGHPEGAQSHRKQNPKRQSHHCVKAYLPSNRSEIVLNEADTEDHLYEQDLLMALVNGAFRYETTGRAAPSEAPASEQSGTDTDDSQLQLSELGT